LKKIEDAYFIRLYGLEVRMIRRIMRWNRTWVVLVAVGLGALNWIVDCILHVQIYHEGTLTQQLFTQEPMEILLRSAGIALLLGFGIALQLAISKCKRAQQIIEEAGAYEEARTYAENIIETVREPLIVLDDNLKVISANKSFYQTFKVNPEETKGRFIYDLGNRQWDIPKLRELLKDILPSASTFENYEIEHNFETIGKKTMLLNARRLVTMRMILLAIEDITERKRLEDDLMRTKEEEFRVVFDNAADGILLAEMESKKFHLGNKAMCRMLGYSSEEIKSLGVMNIHPEKDLPYVVDQFERQVKGEFTLSRDLPVKRKDGSVFYADVNAATIRIAEKTYQVGFFRDTTERKRAYEMVEKSQRELALRNRIVNVFVTVPDEQMYGEVLDILLDAMQSEYGTFGYLDDNGALIVPSLTRGVWDKCSVRDKRVVFPRESWGNSTRARAIAEKKTVCSNQPSVTTPEGHIKIARHIALPIVHHGEVIGLIKVANKKTEYSDSDVQLLETLGKTIAPVLDARLHRDKRELERNKVEQALRKQTHALGERVKELRCLFQVTQLARDVQQPVDGLLTQALETIAAAWMYPDITCVRIAIEGREYVTSNWSETRWTQSAPITNCGGTVGALEVAYLEERPELDEGPFLKEERELIAALAKLFGDFTERRRAVLAVTEQAERLIRSNAELESANQELMKVDRMKSDFVSNVSHELRTPLTAVKAYAETLLEYHSLSEEQRESFLRIILEQSDRLATLVDDLLDLSKIEAGELKMELAPINVNRAIATAMQSVGPGAQKEGIEIDVRPSQEDSYVLADENRFVQVLVNLLNNSVKFTQQGGRIDVISVPVADSAGGSVQSEVKPTYLRITISDNGIGIATEELDRIFDKFKQVDEKTSGKPAGTGLGLTICRNLVEAMGGRIWAESSGGKGSRFHFTLPLAHGPEPERDGLKTHNGQAMDEFSVASHT
jgi:PAS domain S-box-containing protein